MLGLLFLVAVLPYLSFLVLDVLISVKHYQTQRSIELYVYFNMNEIHRYIITAFVWGWFFFWLIGVLTDTPLFSTIAQYITYGLMASGWVWLASCIQKGRVKLWYSDYRSKK